MSDQHALLLIEAGRRRYAIASAQVSLLGLLDPAEAPADLDGRPLICQDLGIVLGDERPAPAGRRYTLTIALRRRSVALLVDSIDSPAQQATLAIQPLAPLLARRLTWPWFLGAVVYRDEPLLVLDLRRIATDVAIGAVSA